MSATHLYCIFCHKFNLRSYEIRNHFPANSYLHHIITLICRKSHQNMFLYHSFLAICGHMPARSAVKPVFHSLTNAIWGKLATKKPPHTGRFLEF